MKKILGFVLAMLIGASLMGVANAGTSTVDSRLDRLEKKVRILKAFDKQLSEGLVIIPFGNTNIVVWVSAGSP